MSSTTTLQLHLTPAWFDEYCIKLQRSTATAEKRLAALDALQTFINAAGPAPLNEKAFIEITTILTTHLTATRETLMNEGIYKVSRALEQQDARQLSVTFNSLSRAAFWEAVEKAIISMGTTARGEVTRWAHQWHKEATARGEEASPYPDSIDLKAAGIELSEYMAMSDLCNAMLLPL